MDFGHLQDKFKDHAKTIQYTRNDLLRMSEENF